ncbi:endonuclease/exonuclease/phosphatase family protein [Streptomyces sp. NPDC018955]|uniref:endonuclease/exonuclease/phosphatase family protein n=1 Tax=Streptomyces sp. NPDC018955 TaxID=3365055 RepID=UPI0037AA0763
MLTVATWNVLHRVHADNWPEEQSKAPWPAEPERTARVAARLAGRTEDVVAAQEVSGDLLAAVRRAHPAGTLHAFPLPRVPRPRDGVAVLANPREHLVILARGETRQVVAEAFPEDPGKGLLAVAVAKTLVVCTHVSSGERRTGQIARLRQLVDDWVGPAVLLGDFNADRHVLTDALGADYAVSDLRPGALPTRPRTTGTKSQYIDHVVVHGAALGGASVEDAGGLSDHNLVRAAVL